MSPAMPQGGDQHNGSGMESVWIIAAIFIAIIGVWYFAHAYIVSIYFSLKLFEISLLNFFSDSLNHIRIFVLNTNPATAKFNTVVSVANRVGYYLRYPVAGILLLSALILYFRDSVSQFKNTYTMTSLAKLGAGNWPQITPVLGLDLVKEDIYKGTWAMALTPMLFAKKYKLIIEQVKKSTEEQLQRHKIVIATLNKERAFKVFAMQLGRPWRGVDALPPHIKALFVAFAARVNRDTKTSQALLQHIAASAKAGHLDFSGVEPLLEKYKHDEKIQKVLDAHHYVLTVMGALLMAAREDGVLASADFIWLKPIDRRLWYMLNSMGRQTPYVEIAGPYAHWLAENELGKKIRTPMVDEAVKALEIALQEIVYHSDKEKETK